MRNDYLKNETKKEKKDPNQIVFSAISLEILETNIWRTKYWKRKRP
jgi:hypothetical protein